MFLVVVVVGGGRELVETSRGAAREVRWASCKLYGWVGCFGVKVKMRL